MYVALAIIACSVGEVWPPILWPDRLWPSALVETPCDTTSEVYKTDLGIVIILEKPNPLATLERVDGPSYQWPHGDCLMCLGNHLIGSHGQSKKYIMSLPYAKWGVLHDNLHNSQEFKGVKGSGEGWIGQQQSYTRRRSLFRRILR